MTMGRKFSGGAVVVATALAAVVGTLACGKNGAGKSDGPPDGSVATSEAPVPSFDPLVALRAEDARRAKDVPDALRTSANPAARRGAARALARIADDASVEGLMRALGDDDLETAAWGAYGLGAACKGREDAHVRALAARAVSVDAAATGSAAFARFALARAVGRCGGALAEPVLAGWVRSAAGFDEAAVYALGDVAGKQHTLTDETMTVLLDAAAGAAGRTPLDVALYPLARIEKVSEAFAPRAIDAAKSALTRPTFARVFAVRALGRAGDGALAELTRVAQTKAFTPAERAEAARALGRMGDAGHAAAAKALSYVTPDKDPFAIAALGGDDFGPLFTLLGAVGGEAPTAAEPALYALASLSAPGTAPEALARRIAALRCGAAAVLARTAYDAEVLTKCDAPGTLASERARLAALVRRPLVGERKNAWVKLAKSANLRMREEALEGAEAHPELGDALRAALVAALESKQGGLVSTAGDLIAHHPERVMILSEKERRTALDPNAPPPSFTTPPAKDLDARVAQALAAALANPWPEDRVEARASLLDALATTHHPAAKQALDVACRDPNVTVRDRAVKSLKTFGEAHPACPAPDAAGKPAPELARLLTKTTKVTLETDAGRLVLALDPSRAPVTVTRLVALARAGFFKGNVVHRVVPGFVVQLGDPDGDGYGGSGSLLRCETSPIPFEPNAIGMALAGRDTGSSQLFVTLARTPHLDGEFAQIGVAEGDWAAVAEGDVVREVTVAE